MNVLFYGFDSDKYNFVGNGKGTAYAYQFNKNY